MKITKNNIPNLISLLRIILIIAIVLVLYPFGLNHYYHQGSGLYQYTLSLRFIVAGIIFLIAAWTDWLDGYLARKWKTVSDFGKFFDSIADKLMCNAVIIIFIALHVIPIWLGLLLILRDFYLDLLRQISANKGIVLAANQWGKWATAIKMISLLLLFYIGPAQFTKIGIYQWVNQITLIPMYVSLILSLSAAVNYTYQIKPQLTTKTTCEN